MHQALYRKWRPHTFNDVYGQEHITSVLKYEVAENKLSHAYLFCGSRGVGKTTCAKILAKAVNCENPQNGEPCGVCPSCLAVEAGTATDILEMDAASNNSVDNIRDIRDEVVFAPALLKYRVYIVDEVHMLSASAFNALLKTLEEPPAYVIFILATTEQHKLPATIVSRCQRFEFRRISTEYLSARINLIAKEENIGITPDAAHLISRLSQGGMRDAISLLELCAGNNELITPELVCETVGSTGRERTTTVAEALASKNYNTIFDEMSELTRSSKSIEVFWQDMIAFWRDMLVFKTTPDASKYLDLTDSETASLSAIANAFTRETLLWHCRLLDDALPKISRSASTARMTAELTLMRMCDEKLDNRTDALLSRISRLEEAVQRGVAVEPAKPAPKPEKPVPKQAKAAEPSIEIPRNIQAKPSDEPVKSVKETPKVAKSVKETPKASEPVKDTPKTAEPDIKVPVSAKSGGRVLRPLRAWVEILEDMSVNDIFLWIDFNTSHAFVDEADRAVVVFDSEFSLKRADKPESIARISKLISDRLGKDTPVSLELLPDNGTEDTVIDEILDNFE